MPNGPDAAAQLAAEEDVGRRGQIVAERQVLVDDLDAVPARFDRPVQDEFRAVHAHGAVARAEIAGDHLDQRRLAGAVVAHQADDLAGFERKRHVVDGLDGAEMLGDVGEFENRHPSSCLPSRRLAFARPRLHASADVPCDIALPSLLPGEAMQRHLRRPRAGVNRLSDECAATS